MKNRLPYIAVTMGDAAGVGPELCLLLVTERRITDICVPVIFGDYSVLKDIVGEKELSFPVITYSDWCNGDIPQDRAILVDCEQLADSKVIPGKVSAECGQAAYVYINRAIDAALSGEVCAVVTAPIHKESFKLAGVNYPGHTEIFAERAGTGKTCMMLTSEKLTVSLVTTHIGYGDVVAALTSKRIFEVIELTVMAMEKMRQKKSPRIIVCALNPHAGEHGLFGNGEEEKIIIPAIERAKAVGINIDGPFPPDTAFVPSLMADVDAVVCMYHDQGLIPFKMAAFDSGVNITLGLKIVRTSVDHGTAFDIVRQNKVNPKSMFEAVGLGVKFGSL